MSKLGLRNAPIHKLPTDPYYLNPKSECLVSPMSCATVSALDSMYRYLSSIYHEPQTRTQFISFNAYINPVRSVLFRSLQQRELKCKLRRMKCLGAHSRSQLGCETGTGLEKGASSFWCFSALFGKIFPIMSFSRFPRLFWSFYLSLEDLLRDKYWRKMILIMRPFGDTFIPSGYPCKAAYRLCEHSSPYNDLNSRDFGEKVDAHGCAGLWGIFDEGLSKHLKLCDFHIQTPCGNIIPMD